MLRLIVAVVVGYVVMAALVVAAFAVAIAAPDLAFRSDSFDVTPGWLAWALAATVLAAVAGGYVAVVIARRRSVASVLAGLVLVLGLVSAAGNLAKERPTVESAAGLSAAKRAARAVQPTWYAFALPVLGAGGVLVGAQLRRRTG